MIADLFFSADNTFVDAQVAKHVLNNTTMSDRSLDEHAVVYCWLQRMQADGIEGAEIDKRLLRA